MKIFNNITKEMAMKYLKKIVFWITIFFFPSMGYAIGTLGGFCQSSADLEKVYLHMDEEGTLAHNKGKSMKYDNQMKCAKEIAYIIINKEAK